MQIMTLAEFKVDYSRETGVVNNDVLNVLYDRYCEAEAEAIAGGKYDVDPELVEHARVSAILAKPFKVYSRYVRYCPITDGAIGNGRMVVAGFDSFSAAHEFVAAECEKGTWVEGDDCWPEIEPAMPHTVYAPDTTGQSLDECPF